MDSPKNGESSRSPIAASGTPTGAMASTSSSALILPQWDAPAPKHLHASLDLISILHLDGLYNTYVRPYFDPVPETDDEGDATSRPRAKKKQGLSKGYVGLLEDCIDPVPMGNQAEHSLLPLIPDMLDHEKPPYVSWTGPLVPLSSESLSSARLEQGTRVDGYAGGEKLGVREAEERRRRKKASRLSQSVAPDLPDLAPIGSPAVTTSANTNFSAGASASVPPSNPAPPRGPRTPFVPRGGRPSAGTPVRPPFPRASAPPTSGNYTPRPGTPAGSHRPGTPAGAGKPGTPRTHTPGFTLAPNRAHGPGTPGLKRPAPPGEYPSVKRVKGGASRSASPMGEVGVKAVFKRRTEEPGE